MLDNTAAYQNLRSQILAPDPLYCGICGELIDKTIKYPADGAPTVDHIIPVSKGGNMLGNMRPAHAGCNRKRQNKSQTLEPARHAMEW